MPTQAGGPVLVAAGSPINFDATRGGTAFMDIDGDSISYELQLLSPDLGLVIQGTHILGTLSGPGVVHFKLSARDDQGGESEQTFSIAVAAPPSERPTLPAVSYVYELESLPLPPHFRPGSPDPLGDTETPDNRVTNAGATLGRVLFYDKRLSITNTHSCGSCHRQSHGFSTPERFPVGVTNVPLKRNSMGLTNVRYTFANRFFADERVDTLEALATMPIEDPNELANSLPLLEAKLAATDFYAPLFTAAFGSSEVTRDRIAMALAQFLRSIVSYQTTFDYAFAAGITNATIYTEEERLGLQIFELSRCRGCHSTPVQTMSEPENNGLDAVAVDPGAGGGRFRTASLRNVAVTAPYMHDGRFATLREVIDHYSNGIVDSPDLPHILHEPGSDNPIRFDYNEPSKRALEAFLNALTDDPVLTDPRWSDPFL